MSPKIPDPEKRLCDCEFVPVTRWRFHGRRWVTPAVYKQMVIDEKKETVGDRLAMEAGRQEIRILMPDHEDLNERREGMMAVGLYECLGVG